MEEELNIDDETNEPTESNDDAIDSMSTDELKNAIERLNESLKEQSDLTLRAQAELINYRKRMDEQRITEIQYLNMSLLAKLLPVSDELEMAAEQLIDDDANAQWLNGIKLIQKKLIMFFESEGVIKIESYGKVFNPLEHEALTTEETNEYESGSVVKVLRNGYKIKDRIIQAAQVVVAKPISE